MSSYVFDEKFSEDVADFDKAIDELLVYIEEGVEEIIKNSWFDLFEAIVARTPVDTGAAASNWKIGVEDSPIADYYATDILANVNQQRNIFFNQNVMDVIWIVNNLDYVSYLEEGRTMIGGKMGGSNQAPQGMVGISLIEFTAILRQQASMKKGIDAI